MAGSVFRPAERFIVRLVGRHELHPSRYRLDDYHHDIRGCVPGIRGVRADEL